MSNHRQRRDIEDTFLQHWSQLRSAAQAIVGVREAAEDVTQSAYVKVLEISGELTVRQPVGFCFQVVRNLAIDHRRRAALESHVFMDESHGEAVPAQLASPEQSLITQQHVRMVEEVLDALPARTRVAFTLYRLNGMTQREIAKELDVSPTLVNFMIRDAIDALKRCRGLVDAGRS
ncbi:sigma-70 family RNA polymerase sigma factor [Steroidobacter flavus]|uniref:Sigma-70 family RNA polymerase sigma factor n=1 Tax=Steroidobacter flavus TaxID=1842136 RepID=A0ABV8T486_9GAMM